MKNIRKIDNRQNICYHVLMENWKPVPFAPDYEVSTSGRIRQTFEGHKTVNGHRQFSFALGGRRYRLSRAADVIWEAFNGPLPVGWKAGPANGDEMDVRLENLILQKR